MKTQFVQRKPFEILHEVEGIVPLIKRDFFEIDDNEYYVLYAGYMANEAIYRVYVE